jgi:D-alanyl-D-alanine carboxypeptidase
MSRSLLRRARRALPSSLVLILLASPALLVTRTATVQPAPVHAATPPSRSAVAVHAAAVVRPTLHGVARHPDALDVLVDKAVRLPVGFVPHHLVVPRVAFVFSGFAERRLLRRDAARALERLFAAAARDGVPLAGVSGYRSEATQRVLFAGYVRQMGLAAASRVSARPGHSEHETGLAIDIAGADGACPASSCFAGTPAARWLAAHASTYGFVVRYPADGEASTGYSYEPWHVRYLGTALARRLDASGLTYERYLLKRG